MGLSSIAAFTACSGVSEDRVKAVETRIGALEADEAPAAWQEKMASTEAATAEALRSLAERVQALEENKGAMEASPASGDSALGALLGLTKDPVQVEGMKYTVAAAWLSAQLEAAALEGPAVLVERPKGLLVRRAPAFTRRLGLNPGDLITSVNGVEVNSKATLAQQLLGLDAKSAARVTVVRKKKPREHVYMVR